MPEHSALVPAAKNAAPVFLYSAQDWEHADGLPADLAALAKAQAFKGQTGQTILSASDDGTV